MAHSTAFSLLRSGAEWELRRSGQPVSQRSATAALESSPALGSLLSQTLRALPDEGVFFECAPLHPGALDRPFRFVAVPSPAVARLRADPRPFAQAFARSGDVAVFENLGRDALLVAPRPSPEPFDGAHMLAFLRTAPAPCIASFWGAVGGALKSRLARRTRPLWLSTSGLGVSWLHMRLDDRPKYISHRPYR